MKQWVLNRVCFCLFVCLFLLLPKLWRHAHSTLHISHSALYFHMWPTFLYNTFPHFILIGSGEGVIENKMGDLNFSTMFVWNVSLQAAQGEMISQMYLGLPKNTCFLSCYKRIQFSCKNKPFWISSRHFLVPFVRSLWFLPDPLFYYKLTYAPCVNENSTINIRAVCILSVSLTQLQITRNLRIWNEKWNTILKQIFSQHNVK